MSYLLSLKESNMFSSYWKFGFNHSYLQPKEVTTVFFGIKGPIETTWKRMFSIKQYGFYYKGVTNERSY
jgi:hypothetical protein